MMLAKGTTVAVADGEKLNLFRNAGDEAGMQLEVLPRRTIENSAGTSGGHQSSSGNPDHGQADEDGFSAGIVDYLNQQALSGAIDGLVIIAAPRALGEMRKHYHKALTAQLKGEIAKDLTGHSMTEVESAIASA
ncbi:host attachment family protein [Devosia sp. SL43]|uniref:host attachment family protein n=1 Tax=Devosia sp. SL43 TaxID=2806348 RepID=UPI001F2CF75F|nr:host attachment protein [Devosia sp. SL43]UJW83903.1 host attachment protein [Devosia sp. SL43]